MAQRAHGGLCQRRTAAEDEDDREHACERQLARQVRAKLCGEGHHAELDAFDEDEEADDHGHQPEEHLARVLCIYGVGLCCVPWCLCLVQSLQRRHGATARWPTT